MGILAYDYPFFCAEEPRPTSLYQVATESTENFKKSTKNDFVMIPRQHCQSSSMISHRKTFETQQAIWEGQFAPLILTNRKRILMHLGVPLLSSRLKNADCSILVEKFMGRVKS